MLRRYPYKLPTGSLQPLLQPLAACREGQPHDGRGWTPAWPHAKPCTVWTSKVSGPLLNLVSMRNQHLQVKSLRSLGFCVITASFAHTFLFFILMGFEKAITLCSDTLSNKTLSITWAGTASRCPKFATLHVLAEINSCFVDSAWKKSICINKPFLKLHKLNHSSFPSLLYSS